jgi:two-component system sensor histidine kinase VanS
VDRPPGLSVRLKLTLSYAGFLMLAGAVLFTVVWLFLRVPTIRAKSNFAPGSFVLLRDFIPATAIVLASLLVFGLLGGWILAGRMLAPLTRITDAARTAATGSLSHRIRLPGRGDEFRELADAFDTMLAQLEAHVAEQQRFAANASHELRTPLAITQALLDAARNDPNRDSGALDERLRAVNARAIDLTEALLLLSRTGQRSFTRQHVDLSLIAEEAAETLLPLAEKRGLSIETSGDITLAAGSPALLLQMTTNLLHNAIVHNLPEYGTVQVSTVIRAESVMLTVENTGAKLTPQLVSTLTEPFQRGAERIRGDHAGVGLGLAIVESIAHAHDGTLTLTPPGRRGALRHGAAARRAIAPGQLTVSGMAARAPAYRGRIGKRIRHRDTLPSSLRHGPRRSTVGAGCRSGKDRAHGLGFRTWHQPAAAARVGRAGDGRRGGGRRAAGGRPGRPRNLGPRRP